MATPETNPLDASKPTPDAVAIGSSGWFGVGVFPTGEARSVNIGTAKKPCWVIEGPKPSAADIQWTQDLVDAVHPIFRASGDRSSDGNLGPSPVRESNTGTLSPNKSI